LYSIRQFLLAKSDDISGNAILTYFCGKTVGFW